MLRHSSLDRLAIYAALGFAEVWRFDGRVLTFHILNSQGQYTIAARSRAFPQLTPADLTHFLPLRNQMDENAVVRQFRVWVRQQLPSSAATPTSP